jgi:RNA-directed DNA polymerase
MAQFYNSQDWEEWLDEENKNYAETVDHSGNRRKIYKKRGYLHFDPRCWLPDRSEEIRKVVSDQKRFASWSFFPFLKTVSQTPRFKHDFEKGRPQRSVKERLICYAAHKDALIYGFCSYSLTKTYEAFIHSNGFADAVSAYRTDLKGDCNIQFAKQVFDYIKNSGECTAIALDIKGFFDNLDHQYLKEQWVRVIGEGCLPNDHYKVYKTLTQFAYVDCKEILDYLNVNLKKLSTLPKSILDLFPEGQHAGFFRQLRERKIIKIQRDIGIPQGSPMSAVLSNIYMVNFDEHLNELAKSKGFLYRRYCDDILIVCSDEMAIEAKQVAYDAIEECKLVIQQSKEEEIVFRFDLKGELRSLNAKEIAKRPHKFLPGREHYFYKPLQYLGFEFNGQDELIRNSSISRFHRKMKRRINKSVRMAYSTGGQSDKIFTRTTYIRYSHIGKRNFISYAHRCAADSYPNSKGDKKNGMDSPKIRGQVANHMKMIANSLSHKNRRRYEQKLLRSNKIVLKRI